MRSLRACPVEGCIPQEVPVRMVFPQPFWAACPSTQAVSPKGFFSSCSIGISHLAACVCSVLSFAWEECILFISTIAFRQWSAAIKSLLPLSKPSPANLPSCILCSAPIMPEARSCLTFLHLDRVSLMLVAPDWWQLGRPDLWSLCCPWGLGLLVSSQSVSDLPYGDCVYLQVGVKCV